MKIAKKRSKKRIRRSKKKHYHRSHRHPIPPIIHCSVDDDICKISCAEAKLFTHVIQRLLGQLDKAHGFKQLSKVVQLSSRFLLASAAKEKAIAAQMVASAQPSCACSPHKDDDLCGCCPDVKQKKRECTIDWPEE